MVLLQAVNDIGRVFSQRDVAKWYKATNQSIRLGDIGAFLRLVFLKETSIKH